KISRSSRYRDRYALQYLLHFLCNFLSDENNRTKRSHNAAKRLREKVLDHLERERSPPVFQSLHGVNVYEPYYYSKTKCMVPQPLRRSFD
ncbi:hypothetical protein NPIL_170891, partial [Nephila pilipes]